MLTPPAHLSPPSRSQMSAEATTAPTVTDPVVEAVAVAQAEAAPAPAPVEAPAAAAVSEETPAPAVAAEATEAVEPVKEDASVAAAEKPTNKRASFSFNKLFKSHVSQRPSLWRAPWPRDSRPPKDASKSTDHRLSPSRTPPRRSFSSTDRLQTSSSDGMRFETGFWQQHSRAQLLID